MGHQHRVLGQADDLLRHAAHQRARQRQLTSAADDDQVGAEISAGLQDLLVGPPGQYLALGVQAALLQLRDAGVHEGLCLGLPCRLGHADHGQWQLAFGGNLAYEGSTDKRTGERYIMLNRYRLDRPLNALVATYVHEAAHKAGYSHRPGQTRDQKCEPPYVMGQLARKLAEPDKWASFVAGKNACRFWREAS